MNQAPATSRAARVVGAAAGIMFVAMITATVGGRAVWERSVRAASDRLDCFTYLASRDEPVIPFHGYDPTYDGSYRHLCSGEDLSAGSTRCHGDQSAALKVHVSCVQSLVETRAAARAAAYAAIGSGGSRGGTYVGSSSADAADAAADKAEAAQRQMDDLWAEEINSMPENDYRGGDTYDMDHDGRTYDDVDADGDGLYESNR